MTKQDRIEMFEKTPLGRGVVLADWLDSKGFFTAPASTKFHGAYEGGLFDHSYAVMNFLVELSAKNGLRWGRSLSPFIIGMFHDLCKIDQYRHPVLDGMSIDGKQTIDTEHWEYNPNTSLKGHGDKSVMLLSQLMCLTEEEVLCIRYHMGAFTDKDEWRDYTNAIHRYPNVLWTHHADMLAAHVASV